MTSPPYFAASHPLQFLPMCQAQVQRQKLEGMQGCKIRGAHHCPSLSKLREPVTLTRES